MLRADWRTFGFGVSKLGLQAQALIKAGCPVGALHGGYVWGRSNPKGVECTVCAHSDKNRAIAEQLCGGTARGESLETMVSKACGV